MRRRARSITGGTENWAPLRWRERFMRVCPERPVALIPDDAIDPARVRYAAVWKPKPGALRHFPISRSSSISAPASTRWSPILTLAAVPLVRVAVDDLTKRMTEYVVMHVLMHHRRQGYYAESQRDKVWAPKLQWAARDLRVGIMGLGVLGRDAARSAGAHRLRRRGLEQHAGSRSRASSASRARASLRDFLARTDVLVCLLPLTPQTRGILNRRTFAQAGARRQARRPGHHQCGPRRAAGRGRHSRRARRRHLAGRDARRVSRPSRCRRTARSGRIRR